MKSFVHPMFRSRFMPRDFGPRDFGTSSASTAAPRASASASAPRAKATAAPAHARVVAPTLPAPAASAAPAAAYQPPPGYMLVPIAAPAAPAPAPAPAAPAPVPAPVATSAETAVMARVRGIMNHPEAVGREAEARRLALETDVPAAEAISRLAAAPRTPSPAVAAGMAGAAIARAALGLAPDPAADMATAHGVAVALGGPSGADAAASARFAADMEEGARTARELLGKPGT